MFKYKAVKNIVIAHSHMSYILYMYHLSCSDLENTFHAACTLVSINDDTDHHITE